MRALSVNGGDLTVAANAHLLSTFSLSSTYVGRRYDCRRAVYDCPQGRESGGGERPGYSDGQRRHEHRPVALFRSAERLSLHQPGGTNGLLERGRRDQRAGHLAVHQPRPARHPGRRADQQQPGSRFVNTGSVLKRGGSPGHATGSRFSITTENSGTIDAQVGTLTLGSTVNTGTIHGAAGTALRFLGAADQHRRDRGAPHHVRVRHRQHRRVILRPADGNLQYGYVHRHGAAVRTADPQRGPGPDERHSGGRGPQSAEFDVGRFAGHRFGPVGRRAVYDCPQGRESGGGERPGYSDGQRRHEHRPVALFRSAERLSLHQPGGTNGLLERGRRDQRAGHLAVHQPRPARHPGRRHISSSPGARFVNTGSVLKRGAARGTRPAVGSRSPPKTAARSTRRWGR